MATIVLNANRINQMSSMFKYVKDSVITYQTELFSLKAQLLAIGSSVCYVDDTINAIQTSTQIQEKKTESLDVFIKKNEEYIADVDRIDYAVASLIHQSNNEFNKTFAYSEGKDKKSWLEWAEEKLTSVGEWCKKLWKSLWEGIAAVAEWFGNMWSNMWSNIMEGLFGGNETDIKPVEPIPIPEPFPSESEEEECVDVNCQTGQFVGYLAFGAEKIVSNPEEGFFMLYDNPTLSTEGEQYYFADLYEEYNLEPYGALQSFGGTGSVLNFNGNSTYGGQSFDCTTGTLVYNGIERYAIAIGPKLQNPDYDYGEINPKDMAYGVCVDISVVMDGKTYYIPAIIVDVKEHSAPTGIFQTGKSFAGESVDTGLTGPIVEWYVVKKENDKNKSAGLNSFNRNGSIIIYREERLE